MPPDEKFGSAAKSMAITCFVLFYWLSKISPSYAEVDLVMPALGRPASTLGELYDSRTQQFKAVTVFNDNLHPDFINQIDTPFTDAKYWIVDSKKSKLNHLDVSAHLKVDIMSGKLTVEGSAKYFNEPKTSALEVEGFLHYKMRTQRRLLNLFYEDLRCYVKVKTLQKLAANATHIVVGLEYGSDVVIKFTDQAKTQDEKTDIEGKLKLAFSVESVSIEGEAEATIKEGYSDSFSNFTLQVYGDINLNPKFILPKNAKEVGALLSSVPQRVRETEDGLGVPMVITLFPIGPFLELLEIQGLKEALVEDLDESIINDFILIFEKIAVVTQELNDLLFQMRYYSNCTSAEDMARVEELKNGFTEAALIFKINVKNAMTAARTRTPYKPIKYKDSSEEEDSTTESTTEGDTDDDESTSESNDDDEKSSTEGSSEEKSSTESDDDEKSSTDGSSEEEEKSSTEGEGDDDEKSSTEGEGEGDQKSSTEASSSTTDSDDPPSPKPTTATEDDEIVEKLRAQLQTIQRSRRSPLPSSKITTEPRLRYPKCGDDDDNNNDKPRSEPSIKLDSDSASSPTSTPPTEKDKRDILQKVLEEYKKSEFHVNKVEVKLERDFESVLNKIELYKVFMNSGVQYFGRYGSFSNLRFQTVDKIIYAIYMFNTTGEDWNSNWELFQNTLKQNFSVLAVVDCAFGDSVCGEITNSSNPTKTVMYQYYAQKLISKDVSKDLEKIENLSFEPLVVSAFGNVHKIGDLYSSTRNQFLGRSLLHPGTNTSQLRLTREVYNNETMDIVDNRLLRKFVVLNVQPLDQRYNILIDSRGLQRSGLTFKEKDGFDPRLTSQTLLHIYNTIQEGVLDADENSFDFISIPRLFKGGATHFVQSVVYGGVSSISLSAPLSEKNTSFEVEPVLKKDLRRIKDLLDEKSREAAKSVDSFLLDEGCDLVRALGPAIDLASGEQNQIRDLDLKMNYSISIASDIFQSSSSHYESKDDLRNFLNQFPQNKVKGCNGRGKPVVYILYPLTNLQKYFGVIPKIPQNPINQPSPGPDSGRGQNLGPMPFSIRAPETQCPAEKEFKDITKATEVTRIFEALLDAEGQLSALKVNLKAHSEYVTPETEDDFSQVREDFYNLKRNITDGLRHAVALKNPLELENVIDAFKVSPLFNTTMSHKSKFIALSKFQNQTKKIQWLSKFRQVFHEVNYVGRGKALGKEWTHYDPSENVYVLFHFLDKAVIDDPVWLENLNLFRGNLAKMPYNKLILLDCDFDDLYCQNLTGPVIHLYKNLHQMSSDVLEEWKTAEARLREKKAVPVVRETLGRQNVRIGQLYNIRTEKFTGKSIFKTNGQNGASQEILMQVPQDFKVHTPFVIKSSDLKSKYEVMNVEPELQLALMFEGIRKEFEFGSGAILEPSTDFFQAVVLRVHSSIWRLNQSSPALPQYFDPLSLSNQEDPEGPTHYIKGVTLGFNVIVALGHSAVPEDVEFIRRYLSQLEGSTVATTISSATKTPASPPEPEHTLSVLLQSKQDFTIYTDFPVYQQHVIHGGSLQNLLEKIRDLIQAEAVKPHQLLDIRGPSTSISFELEPIESLQQPLGTLVPPYDYTPFSPSFRPQPIVDTYFEYFTADRKRKEREREMKGPFIKQGMTDESLGKLKSLTESMANASNTFKDVYKNLFERVKNGAQEESSLTENLHDFRIELTPDGEFVKFVEGMQRELDKLKFLEYLKNTQNQSHCDYIGRHGDKNGLDISTSGPATDKYVLFFGQPSLENPKATQAEKWIETVQLFFKYLTRDSNETQKCFVVDCDFPDNSIPFPVCKGDQIGNGPLVYKFSDGVVNSTDYIKDMQINRTKTEEEIDHQKRNIQGLTDQIQKLRRKVDDDSKDLKAVSSQSISTFNTLDRHLKDYASLNETVEETVGKVDAVSNQSVQTFNNLESHLLDFTQLNETMGKTVGKVDSVSSQSTQTFNTLESHLRDFIQLNETMGKTVEKVGTLEHDLDLLLPRSCSDALKLLPSERSKKQSIHPYGAGNRTSLEVLCDFETDGGGWTIIQKRSSGPKEEFKQNWNEYQNGFGSLDGNFWLGLENIHALTRNGDQELRIQLEDFEGNTNYAKYSSFSASDASDFYKLTVGGFSGDSTLQDSMADNNGSRFTTIDKDNDNRSYENCAVKFGGGGWWFNDCTNSNLNGLYFEKGETVPQFHGIYWFSWKGSFYSLATSEMKIRTRK